MAAGPLVIFLSFFFHGAVVVDFEKSTDSANVG